MSYRIRFNKPYVAGSEIEQVARCVSNNETAGDGWFSRECQNFLQQQFLAPHALLTTSCTAALEMAALLCELQSGDEVIMPSYTFASTANAFLLRGATLRFIDVRPDTLNLDERLLSAAVTARTRVVVPVHYAGVACEMDAIAAIARKNNLLVVEDAAQAVNATYKGAFLGTLGDLGAYSFHATKNISCGEGGALLINATRFLERAETIREKGTNRSRFYRGQVDKYTWVDIGSSYVMADLLAAFLLVQLQHAQDITARRQRAYQQYAAGLRPLAERGLITLPTIPAECGSNYHIFFLLTENLDTRSALIEHLKAAGILAVFHYVPLHMSPMGASLGYESGMLPVTESISDRVLRLPIFPDLTSAEVDDILGEIFAFYGVRRAACS